METWLNSRLVPTKPIGNIIWRSVASTLGGSDLSAPFSGVLRGLIAISAHRNEQPLAGGVKELVYVR